MIILEFLDDFRDLELELGTNESGSWFIGYNHGYNRGQPSNYIEPDELRFLQSQLQQDMTLRLIGRTFIARFS